jgi:TonB family protein
MRIFCTTVLISLIASGISFGQVPENWNQWVEDGLAAEDDSKYKDAEKLFGQACDVSLAPALGSERLTRACLMLSRTYAVQGKWRQAADAAGILIAAQQRFENATAEDKTRALIGAAEADMARGDYDGATESIRKAAELTRELDIEAAASAFVDLSTFYMPAGNKGFGPDLLDAAVKALSAKSDKADVRYLNTAARVGRGLCAYGRWDDAASFLRPLVLAGEQRLDIKPEHDDLWDAYRSVANAAIAAFKSMGDDREADRLKELSDGWPREVDVRSTEYSAPRLTHKVEPQYTQGARANHASGMAILSLVVGADGRAHDVQIEQALPYGLSWEAVRAIRQWRFRPAALGGEAIPIRAQIEVTFRYLD